MGYGKKSSGPFGWRDLFIFSGSIIGAGLVLGYGFGWHRSFDRIEGDPVSQAMIYLKTDGPGIIRSGNTYFFSDSDVSAVYYDVAPSGFSCGDMLVYPVTRIEAFIACWPMPSVVSDPGMEAYAKDLVARVKAEKNI